MKIKIVGAINAPTSAWCQMYDPASRDYNRMMSRVGFELGSLQFRHV